ncbi:MAG: hypothetical protein JNM84_01505 [Planctomycetes bacterium]|nr:hypothetical protein [Planctomycetota bacterium]
MSLDLGPLIARALISLEADLSLMKSMEISEAVRLRIWGQGASKISPFWRYISFHPNQPFSRGYHGFGASRAASLQGLGALGIIGITIVVAAGVYMALGAGYLAARERATQRGFLTGFSRGFVMGVLDWKWTTAAERFGLRYAYFNPMDPTAGRMEAQANNEGLFFGFCTGLPIPADRKKEYRKALRHLAGRSDDAPWSTRPDVARLQQIDYVSALAGAGVKSGLIAAE